MSEDRVLLLASRINLAILNVSTDPLAGQALTRTEIQSAITIAEALRESAAWYCRLPLVRLTADREAGPSEAAASASKAAARRRASPGSGRSKRGARS